MVQITSCLAIDLANFVMLSYSKLPALTRASTVFFNSDYITMMIAFGKLRVEVGLVFYLYCVR